MRILQITTCIFAGLGVMITANAEQKIKIPIDKLAMRVLPYKQDGYYRIDLRKGLRRQGCRLQLNGARLIAKAPDNHNKVALRIGDWQSPDQTIPGDLKGWGMPNKVAWPWKASRNIRFYNRNGHSFGPWLLVFNGPIKIRAVDIFVAAGRSCR